jgi:hypothetical protein
MMSMMRPPSGSWSGPGDGPGPAGGSRLPAESSTWTAVVTRPELYLLAMVGKAGHLLGLEDPFLGCLAEEVEDLLGYARRTLAARGHLLLGPDQSMMLPPVMADLIRTNSQARRTLVISSAEQVRLIHVMARHCLEQQDLADGRIALRAVPGAGSAAGQVAAALSLPVVPVAPGAPITLAVADFATARQRALGRDHLGCAAILEEARLAPEIAASLTDALSEAGTSGSVTTLLREARAIRYGESTAWIIGGQGGWLVQALDQRRGSIRLLPSSSEAIWRRIETIAGGAR